jgi:hypothetical protein
MHFRRGRGHVDPIEPRSPEHHAANHLPGEIDARVDAAVRSDANNAGIIPLRAPDKTFRIGRSRKAACRRR